MRDTKETLSINAKKIWGKRMIFKKNKGKIF